MKKINPVNLKIDCNMDSDDLGSRIVECFQQVSSETDYVNLVKVQCSEDLTWEQVGSQLQQLRQLFRSEGITNCVFVPLHNKGIQNITIDKLEVINVHQGTESTTD